MTDDATYRVTVPADARWEFVSMAEGLGCDVVLKPSDFEEGELIADGGREVPTPEAFDDMTAYIEAAMAEDYEITADEFRGRPCAYCGTTISFANWPANVVMWDTEVFNHETGEIEPYIQRDYFCSEACKRDAQRDEAWLRKEDGARHDDGDRIRRERREAMTDVGTTHYDPDDPAPPRFGNGMAPGTAIKWVYLPRWHLDVKSDRGLIVADGGVDVTPFDELTEEQKQNRLELAAYLGREMVDDEADEEEDGDVATDGGQTVATPRATILDTLSEYGTAGLGELALAAEVDRSYRETVAALGTLEAGGLVEQVGSESPQWRLTERGEAHV